MKKYVLLWLIGLCTFVPVTTYHLLFKAQTYQLPLLLLVALWTFGFWPCFVPLYKQHRAQQFNDGVTSPDDIKDLIQNSESKQVAVHGIAVHTGLPMVAAEKLYQATAHTMGVTDNTNSTEQRTPTRKQPANDQQDNNTTVTAISNKTSLPSGMAEKLHKVAANKIASNDQGDEKAA